MIKTYNNAVHLKVTIVYTFIWIITIKLNKL